MSTFETSGKFFDGESAKSNAVAVSISPNGVLITGEGIDVNWPMDQIRNLADQARDKGMVIETLDHTTARLVLLDDAAGAYMRQHNAKLGKRHVSSIMKKRVAFWGVGAMASVYLIMFIIIPAMANTLAGYIPVEREVAMGKVALGQIEWLIGKTSDQDDLICQGAQGQKALDKMVARLTPHMDVPYPLDVKVYRSPMINAFAVPGGHVVLFDGLLAAANTPEEVAGVLGHEFGHVAHRDPTRLSLRTAGSAGILGLVFGDFSGGFAALALAETLISASYAQDAETNADAFSHDLFERAQLPSARFADFFSNLREDFGDQNGLMSHIASHPDLEGRQQAAMKADVIGDRTFEPVLTSLEWAALKRICTDG
ncbi:metalloendopeptidase [Amylibacter marinus]|uniref:Metalloendopeptidase n=1 Tax=Amylibacter marinus TaxID=1475483 RepID=A0ABQ5VV70_9RHOB|nr:M48 family metallopeptidase [Amylibacter marinus]GLQ35133.1 metalloendopeptidase [Amylibacter marinus]